MFIAKNIKYLRDKEWLSQSKFAELFQLNRGNIASYEAGSEPTLSVIISIANYFNISIDDLIASDLSESISRDGKKEKYPEKEYRADISACTEKDILIGSLRETLEAQKCDLKSKDLAINALQEALNQIKARIEEYGISSSKRK